MLKKSLIDKVIFILSKSRADKKYSINLFLINWANLSHSERIKNNIKVKSYILHNSILSKILTKIINYTMLAFVNYENVKLILFVIP